MIIVLMDIILFVCLFPFIRFKSASGRRMVRNPKRVVDPSTELADSNLVISVFLKLDKGHLPFKFQFDFVGVVLIFFKFFEPLFIFKDGSVCEGSKIRKKNSAYTRSCNNLLSFSSSSFIFFSSSSSSKQV